MIVYILPAQLAAEGKQVSSGKLVSAAKRPPVMVSVASHVVLVVTSRVGNW